MPRSPGRRPCASRSSDAPPQPPAEWTFHDEPLLRADKDLAAITASWREHVADVATPATVADDAGCYLRVEAPHAVRDEVVCGPVRYEGGGTEWEAAQIASYYARDGRVALGLVEPPGTAFETLRGAPPRDLRAADGTQPDREPVLPAPQLPVLPPGELAVEPAPGDVVAMLGEDDPSADDGFRMLTIGEDSVLLAFAAADRSLTPPVRHRPPPGHRLVAVTLLSLPPDTARNGRPLHASLRPGDDAPAIPLDPSTLTPDGQEIVRVLVAVPEGREAHVDITDGTHHATAGSGAGDARSDVPPVAFGAGDQAATVAPPAGTDGPSLNARLSPIFTAHGPEAPGDPWHLRLSMMLVQIGDGARGPILWSVGGTPRAQYTTTTSQMLEPTMTADGVAVPAQVDMTDPSTPTITGSVALVQEPRSVELRGTLHLVGTDPTPLPGASPADAVPAEVVVDIPVAVTLMVEPTDPGARAEAW